MMQKKILSLFKIFSGKDFEKMDLSCFTPSVFRCTRKVNMYLASAPSERMASSQKHAGLTCCMPGEKELPQQTCSLSAGRL